MFDLKGFIEIGPLRDNAPNVLSPVGELSDHSASYSRDKTNYRKSNMQVELISFTSKKDNIDITTPSTYTDHVLEIAQWVYDNAINGTIKNDQEEFHRLLIGRFSSSMTKVYVGGMIGHRGNWFPRSITWTFENKEQNEITIWFTDADFRRGYRDYTIIIVPPVEPVDTFQSTVGVVSDALKGFNLPDHHNKAKEKSQDIPYTYIMSHDFTWHDRENYETTQPTTWSVLIWGAAGANPSNIKRAYREQILENSAYPYKDWVNVFPEIFTSTRFTFIPGWKIRGLPNLEEEASLYSPILPYDFVEDAMSQFAVYNKDGKSGELKTEVSVFPSLYKSLNSVCIAGDENLKEYQSIFDIVPNYALIRLTGSDISFVDKDTNEFMRLFISALIAAEEYHPYAPTHEISFSFDEDNPEIRYVLFEFKNVEFRVIMRTAKWLTNK